MIDVRLDTWLGPEQEVARPTSDEISRAEAVALLQAPLRDESASTELLESLRQNKIPLKLGELSVDLDDKQLLGDGGYKRVFALPISPYVVAIPNRTKGFRNIAHWERALQEPAATQRFREQTGVLANPDAYLAGGTIGEVDFPLIVMRGWESFRGVVLDSKSTTHSKRFSMALTDPSVDATVIREQLDPAISEVESLLAQKVYLGGDSLNLIWSGDGESGVRLFASEITDPILEQAENQPLEYASAKRAMVWRVLDTFFKHTVGTSDFFKHSQEWEALIQKVADSYGVK
jgi:hypothetical protein